MLASTGAVYEPSTAAHHETSPLAPDDVYGHSKLWSEQAVRLWERRTGVACGVARLFNVVGPGETNPHLVPEIVAQAASGDELRLGNLDSRRDYVYVDDVASGLHALAGHAATVNLGSGEAVDGHTHRRGARRRARARAQRAHGPRAAPPQRPPGAAQRPLRGPRAARLDGGYPAARRPGRGSARLAQPGQHLARRLLRRLPGPHGQLGRGGGS